MRLLQFGCLLLLVLLVCLALEVVRSSYNLRVIYDEVEVAYKEQLRLETLQGQLRIEHGTWISPADVEVRARNEIGLSEPVDSQLLSLSSGS